MENDISFTQTRLYICKCRLSRYCWLTSLIWLETRNGDVDLLQLRAKRLETLPNVTVERLPLTTLQQQIIVRLARANKGVNLLSTSADGVVKVRLRKWHLLHLRKISEDNRIQDQRTDVCAQGFRVSSHRSLHVLR